MDSLGVGYIDVNGMSGGERVRLCNPCVPDPNTAPPQSSTGPTTTTPPSPSPRSSHQRSRSSIGNAYGAATASNRYGVVFASGQSHDPFQAYAPRNRSLTVVNSYFIITAAVVLLTRSAESRRTCYPRPVDLAPSWLPTSYGAISCHRDFSHVGAILSRLFRASQLLTEQPIIVPTARPSSDAPDPRGGRVPNLSPRTASAPSTKF